MGGGSGWGRGAWWGENGDNHTGTTIKIIIKIKKLYQIFSSSLYLYLSPNLIDPAIYNAFKGIL